MGIIRLLFVVAVAILVFRIIRMLKEDNNIHEQESPAPGAGGACNQKIKSLDELLAYTEHCLEFPKEAMDCVQQMYNRKQDGLLIAIECTPNLPESMKKRLRKYFELLNKRREVKSRCRMDNNSSKECENELTVIDVDVYEVVHGMGGFLSMAENFHGPAKKAFIMFNLLMRRLANFSSFIN